MVGIYDIKTYGEIADFLTNEYSAGNIPASYTYYGLIPQIINAFRNLSYSTKEDLYARMFLDASNQLSKRINMTEEGRLEKNGFW